MRPADVRERRLTLRDLRRASEAFITNAPIEIVPVRRVGPLRFRETAAARTLNARYRDGTMGAWPNRIPDRA